jgi:hypothetical protein
MPARTQPRLSSTAFRVRFRGALEASWFANLQNVTLTIARRGSTVETTLTATAPDEAALMGVLNLLYELGCPLIALECLD